MSVPDGRSIPNPYPMIEATKSVPDARWYPNLYRKDVGFYDPIHQRKLAAVLFNHVSTKWSPMPGPKVEKKVNGFLRKYTSVTVLYQQVDLQAGLLYSALRLSVL